MLCLFKNSQLSPGWHFAGQFIGFSLVVYWLYFAFVEKNFIHKMFSGQALVIDLLLGLPVVLVFAVVIYAFSYWLLKLVVIIVLPNTIIPLENMQDSDEDLNPEFGEDYWNKLPEDVQATSKTVKNS